MMEEIAGVLALTVAVLMFGTTRKITAPIPNTPSNPKVQQDNERYLQLISELDSLRGMVTQVNKEPSDREEEPWLETQFMQIETSSEAERKSEQQNQIRERMTYLSEQIQVIRSKTLVT